LLFKFLESCLPLGKILIRSNQVVDILFYGSYLSLIFLAGRIELCKRSGHVFSRSLDLVHKLDDKGHQLNDLIKPGFNSFNVYYVLLADWLFCHYFFLLYCSMSVKYSVVVNVLTGWFIYFDKSMQFASKDCSYLISSVTLPVSFLGLISVAKYWFVILSSVSRSLPCKSASMVARVRCFILLQKAVERTFVNCSGNLFSSAS